MKQKRSYKPKEKDAQRLKVALRKFSTTKEFDNLPEELKKALL